MFKVILLKHPENLISCKVKSIHFTELTTLIQLKMSLRYGFLSSNIRSRSRRAGLHFPVGRVHRHLRKGPYASRIGSFAPVYLAAVMEYLYAEIIELAGESRLLKFNVKFIFVKVFSPGK